MSPPSEPRAEFARSVFVTAEAEGSSIDATISQDGSVHVKMFGSRLPASVFRDWVHRVLDEIDEIERPAS